jgi:hypothetical protein
LGLDCQVPRPTAGILAPCECVSDLFVLSRPAVQSITYRVEGEGLLSPVLRHDCGCVWFVWFGGVVECLGEDQTKVV